MSLAKTILDIMGQKHKQLNMNKGGAKNNQAPNRSDPTSPGTSNDAKTAVTQKPSVLLKSTPDAFYTKKNNNGNKRDLISQIANGSQNGSCSSKSNSFDESELTNSSKNRRNSDSNKQGTNSTNNNKNNNKLSKQISADSVLSNITRNSYSQTKGTISNNKNGSLSDNQNSQVESQGDNKKLSNQKTTDRSLFFNSVFSNSVPRNTLLEEYKPDVNSRRESIDSVSESASIIVKARNTPINKVSDGNDSDSSLDTYSITASFEIKEALPDCEEKENILYNNSSGERNENVTYLRCPESVTIVTEHEENKKSGDDEHLITSLDQTTKTELNIESENLHSIDCNNYSYKSKTDNENVSETNDRITEKVENEKSKENGDLVEGKSNGKISIDECGENPMCFSGSNINTNNENTPESDEPVEQTERALSKPTKETDVDFSENIKDSRTHDLNESNANKPDQGNRVHCDPEEKEQNIEETNNEDKEIPIEESSSEEDESDDEKLEEEEEFIEVQNVDTKQMDTEVLSDEPKPKVKKFVRFALIHNTYHGSDTSESEEDDEEEDSEEEEEEEEEDDVEEETKDVPCKIGEDKLEVDVPRQTIEDILQPDDMVNDVISFENVPEPNEPSLQNLEPQIDPFESTRLEYEANIRNLQTEKTDFEDRLHNLTSDLELKQLELNQLKGKIGELENQVLTKTWAMDRQQAELVSATKESEHVRQKLRRLENDLTEYRLKNSDLTEELVRKTAEEAKRKEDTCDFFKIRELEEKLFDATEMIKAMEEQMNGIRKNQEEAKEAEKIMKAETEVEMKIMREALDEALKQKSILQKRFESEFNQLRSTSTAQEQQLLDDFEWKLREVEQSCKKKIVDADKCKRELEAQVVKLTAEIEELSKFKNVEAELAQLRSVSHEHQRSIRTITRQKEELQVNEKILNEELSRLRAALEKEKNHITTLQAIHSREITEKNRKHQFKLEQQKSELQEQFEERLKKEALRVKVESEKHHLEDKRVAIEHTRAQADAKLQEQKKKWEKQLADAQKQVDSLKDRLKESERLHRREVESAQTHSDQNMLELRRKFDKLDMGYQEQIEKAQEKHEKEIEHLTEEYERRLGQCESSWQQQLSTTRTTLELVKEQMRRDTYEQVQQLKTQHQRELEEQWTRLIQERDEALAELEQRHRTTIEQLRGEIEMRTKKSHTEAELRERVKQLEEDLQSSNILIQSLQSSLQTTNSMQQQHQQPQPQRTHNQEIIALEQHRSTQEPQISNQDLQRSIQNLSRASQEPNKEPARPNQVSTSHERRKRASSERQRTNSDSNSAGTQEHRPRRPATNQNAGPSHQENTSAEPEHHFGNTGQSKRKKRNRNRNRQ